MGTMGLALPWKASDVPTEWEKFEAVNGAAPRPEQPASYLAEISWNGTRISSAPRERGTRVEPSGGKLWRRHFERNDRLRRLPTSAYRFQWKHRNRQGAIAVCRVNARPGARDPSQRPFAKCASPFP
jgi:hypothetical protein